MKYLALVACLAIGLVACSDEASTDEAPSIDVSAVDAVMQGVRDALAAGDVAGFMEPWTDNGLNQVFFESGDAFVGNTGYYLAAKQYALGVWSEPVVVGDTASAVAPLFFRLVGTVRLFSLIKVDGVWKIVDAPLTTSAVGDALAIDVDFGGSAIEFDTSLIVDGNIALQIHNSSTQRHQLNILTAPANEDLSAFFEHPEDAPPLPEGRSMPEGFDFIGGIDRIEPGMSVTLLFLNPLPAARYAMFCNDEDAQSGEPHSKSGEYAEFTIT